MDDIILQKVRELQRIYRHGIFPWMLQSRLPFVMSEGYIRKTMYRLWCEGRLHRVGGANARKGDVVPLVVSRLQVVPTVGRLRPVA